MAIFVIGMVSVVFLMNQGAASQSRARDAETVGHLVEDMLAEISADPRFVVGSRFPEDDSVYGNFREHPDFPGFEVRVRVEQDDPATRRSLVEIEVRYHVRAVEKTHRRRALLLRRVDPAGAGS